MLLNVSTLNVQWDLTKINVVKRFRIEISNRNLEVAGPRGGES